MMKMLVVMFNRYRRRTAMKWSILIINEVSSRQVTVQRRNLRLYHYLAHLTVVPRDAAFKEDAWICCYHIQRQMLGVKMISPQLPETPPFPMQSVIGNTISKILSQRIEACKTKRERTRPPATQTSKIERVGPRKSTARMKGSQRY